MNNDVSYLTPAQELITPRIQAYTGAVELKFASSGREDCDVRMLGKGRPFLVELIDAKKKPESMTHEVLRKIRVSL